jgi:hypothetical protein
MADGLRVGGGRLTLTTDTSALPTIQNLLVAQDSLRSSVSNPYTPSYRDFYIKDTEAGGFQIAGALLPVDRMAYIRKSDAFGMRLANTLPYIRRSQKTGNESLIAAYRPFKHYDGVDWVDVLAWRWDGTRWVGLPYYMFSERWRH